MQLVEYNRLEIVDLPYPNPESDDVVIAVRSAGICGSDVHGIDGSTGRRIPPIVMGHELSGVIVELGAGVAGLRTGDRVTVDSTLYCGRCSSCRAGRTNFCIDRRVLGVSTDEYQQQGGFAEFVRVPARTIYRIPSDVSFDHAAMVEPLSVALHALSITPHETGGRAVVVGAGMIGLLLIQLLKISGCSDIVAIDIDSAKLEKAADLGATRTINTARDDLEAFQEGSSPDSGIESVFDAVGTQASFESALRFIGRGGTLTMIGNLSQSITLPLQKLVTMQIRLQGSNASAGEYEAALRLLAAGLISLDPLISAGVPLEDGASWFKRLRSKEKDLFKILLHPNARNADE